MAAPARILIVDDEAGLVEAVATALCPHHEVLTAYTGRAAFETLARHPVDLVILDHRLPDMEGVVLLRFLKRLFPSVVVIYMTAYGSEDLAVEFYDSGGRKYLRKPFDIAVLLAKVDAYLAVRRNGRETRRPLLEGQGGAPALAGNGSPNGRVAHAIAYIEEHVESTLRLRDVARAAGLSKSYLARAFKRTKGETVEQFILSRRMAHGIALLFDLNLSIKAVAALVGFTDPTNFTRAFHRATGWTPSDLRQCLLARLAPGSVTRREPRIAKLAKRDGEGPDRGDVDLSV